MLPPPAHKDPFFQCSKEIYKIIVLCKAFDCKEIIKRVACKVVLCHTVIMHSNNEQTIDALFRDLAEQRPGDIAEAERLGEIRRAKQRQKNAHHWALFATKTIEPFDGRTRNLPLQVMPKWAIPEKIAFIYSLARQLTLKTGVEYQVDHVVPLRNKLVSGLHTEQNLVAIPKLENLKKGNHYWPDMPGACA